MKRKIQITETELVNLIKRVINEQNQSYFGCEVQSPGGGPCQCIPLIVGQSNPPIQNNMTFPSMQACQNSPHTCCGGDVQPWSCVNGHCVQEPNGIYASLADCRQVCGEDRFDCVDNRCTRISQTDPGYSNAPFQTMDDCLDSMCGDRRRPDNPRGPRGPKHDMPRNNTIAEQSTGQPNTQPFFDLVNLHTHNHAGEPVNTPPQFIQNIITAVLNRHQQGKGCQFVCNRLAHLVNKFQTKAQASLQNTPINYFGNTNQGKLLGAKMNYLANLGNNYGDVMAQVYGQSTSTTSQGGNCGCPTPQLT